MGLFDTIYFEDGALVPTKNEAEAFAINGEAMQTKSLGCSMLDYVVAERELTLDGERVKYSGAIYFHYNQYCAFFRKGRLVDVVRANDAYTP